MVKFIINVNEEQFAPNFDKFAGDTEDGHPHKALVELMSRGFVSAKIKNDVKEFEISEGDFDANFNDVYDDLVTGLSLLVVAKDKKKVVESKTEE